MHLIKKTRVLILPAGELNAAEVVTSLSNQVNIQVYGASSVDRLGPFILDNYANGLARANEPSFVSDVNALVDKWGIDLILPTHDSVVLQLSKFRTELLAVPMVPSVEAAEMCRDKHVLYQHFKGYWFTPRIISMEDEVAVSQLWVKPRRGQGGQGGRRISTDDAKWKSSVDWQNEIVTEFFPGEELTVDCFTGSNLSLQGIFPRSRDRVLGGVSVAASAIEIDEAIKEIAGVLNNELQIIGQWYFQLIRHWDGRWRLLEVSARPAGGQVLTRARGINLPLLSVYAHLGKTVALLPRDLPISLERSLSNYFRWGVSYKTVYLDLDDTLIVSDRPNSELIAFVYECLAKGISVNLLTKHKGSVQNLLRRFAISPNLFRRIIKIPQDARKSDYIRDTESIFIDNAFNEREEVQRALGIPVFDVSDVDILRGAG